MNVAVLGASPKPDRYAHMAQQMLMEAGHRVFPVSPTGQEILDIPGYRSLLEIPEDDGPVDTVTVYLNPTRFAAVIEDVFELGPDRIIFNPGTESDDAARRCSEAGIDVVEACTLVLLQTNQFEPA